MKALFFIWAIVAFALLLALVGTSNMVLAYELDPRVHGYLGYISVFVISGYIVASLAKLATRL